MKLKIKKVYSWKFWTNLGLASFLAVFNLSLPSNEAKPLPSIPTPSQGIVDPDPTARRAHILEELQSTERHFLARMQHLLQDYHAPLKARAKSTDPMLNMYQVNTLFPRSLEVIVKAHEAFYTALEAASESEIPHILLEHVISTPFLSANGKKV
jgi:RhoGEF domain